MRNIAKMTIIMVIALITLMGCSKHNPITTPTDTGAICIVNGNKCTITPNSGSASDFIISIPVSVSFTSCSVTLTAYPQNLPNILKMVICVNGNSTSIATINNFNNTPYAFDSSATDGNFQAQSNVTSIEIKFYYFDSTYEWVPVAIQAISFN